MDQEAERQIRRRALDRCEYCHLPESAVRFRHMIDHIIARQHGGRDSEDNLALACGRCNRFKGPNIAGIDPETGKLCRLFNPRRDRWNRHFRFEGATISGKTPIGRTTALVLGMNDPLRLAARRALLDEGITLE